MRPTASRCLAVVHGNLNVAEPFSGQHALDPLFVWWPMKHKKLLLLFFGFVLRGRISFV